MINIMNKTSKALSSVPFRVMLAVTAVLSVVFGLQAYFVVAATVCAVLIMLSPTGNSAVFHPIAAATVVVFTCFGKTADLVPLGVMLVPLAASVALNIVLYKKKLARRALRTHSMNGMIAVAIAVLIGGIGMTEPAAYLGWGTYYILGLSIAPIGVYVLTRLLMSGDDADRVTDDFAGAVVLGALISAGVILAYYVVCAREFAATHSTLSCLHDTAMRNQIAVFIVPASALSVLRARDKKRYIAVSALLIAASLLSSSRTALLFSIVSAAGVLLYLVLTDKTARHKKRTVVTVCVIGAAVIAGAAAAFGVLSSRSVISGMFSSDIRLKLWERGLRDFTESPIVGKGILNSGNSRYFPVGISDYELQWYHNAAVQVIGSFGIVGILAYGYQIWVRMNAALRAPEKQRAIVLAVYLGLVLMSMTEPGLFCPFPTAVMPPVMFAVLDEAESRVTQPQSHAVRRNKRKR